MARAGAGNAGDVLLAESHQGAAPPTIIPTTAEPSAASPGKTGAVVMFARIAVPYS
jgi:hypothetical protein